MSQMTHSKPIKKGKLTQAWFDGFEQYRERTSLFPHPTKEPTAQVKSQEPSLLGFEETEQKPVARHMATFPMLGCSQKTR